MICDMTLNHGEVTHEAKSVVCIYTNSNKNEFAIDIKEDKQFRAMTKVGEAYTRFVDCYDLHMEDENEIDWKQELKNWISAAKKDESIFLEVDFRNWNELGERIN
jgi:predicted metal-dependent peptidase